MNEVKRYRALLARLNVALKDEVGIKIVISKDICNGYNVWLNKVTPFLWSEEIILADKLNTYKDAMEIFFLNRKFRSKKTVIQHSFFEHCFLVKEHRTNGTLKTFDNELIREIIESKIGSMMIALYDRKCRTLDELELEMDLIGL